MTLLHTLVAFIVAIGVLVLVHELGHYGVARAFNVKILRFSLGFGPALWVRRWGADQTEWALCAIPLGGYVSMLHEKPDDPTSLTPEDLPRAYSQKPVVQRMMIVLAGPLANLLLAVCIYAGLAWNGLSEPRPLLDTPLKDSPAASAGLLRGDEILSINDAPVRSWVDARWRLLEAGVDREIVNIEVRDAQGVTRRMDLDLSTLSGANLEKDVLQGMGLRLMSGSAVVRGVESGSPGEQGGLREGDVLLTVDEVPITSVEQFIYRVQGAAGRSLNLTVQRQGAVLPLQVRPRSTSDTNQQGRLGVSLGAVAQMTTIHYSLSQALGYALAKTWETSIFSLRMLGKMVVGDISLTNLSGPLTIADVAGQTARIGVEQYLYFLALISISIGVLNLLPIPMLDGGHLMYHAVELVRGKPLSPRSLERLQRLGLGILAVMMSIAFVNDLTRLFA